MAKNSAHADQRAAITEELARIRTAFEPDELAYLALTTRVENQIRNRLAWRLHQRVEPHGMIAARDWLRADLAILDSGARPLTTVHAKALNDADARSDLNWRAYSSRIQADARKTRKTVGAEGQILLLAVAVGVQGDVERPLRSVLKHVPSGGKSDALDAGARAQMMTARLSELGSVDSFRIADGQAFKLQVRVDGFLVGPL